MVSNLRLSVMRVAGLVLLLAVATKGRSDPPPPTGSATLAFSRISAGAAASSSGMYRTESELQVQGTATLSQNSADYQVTNAVAVGSIGPVRSNVRHSYLYP